MKPSIAVVGLSAIIFLANACSPKVAPTVATAEVKPEAGTSIPLPIPQEKNTPTDSVKTELLANRINAPLIAAGKKVYESSCNRCHGLFSPNEFTQERWVGLVNWMAPKARLSDEEKAQVLAYVQRNAKDASPVDH